MKDLSEGSKKLFDVSQIFLSSISIPMNIGVTPSIGSKQFIPTLDLLKKNSPPLEFEVVVDSEENLLTRLENIELDVIVVPKVPSLKYDEGLFDETLLYEENFHATFHKKHRFSKLKTVTLKDFESEVSILRLNCEIIGYLQQYCMEHNIKIQAKYRCESDKWVMDLVAANIGVSIFPESCISHPNVRSLPLADINKTREIITLNLKSQKNTPKLTLLHQAFDQILKKRVPERKV